MASSYTFTTDPSGHYASWLDQGQNPVTIIVAGDNWRAQVDTVTITERKATTANNFTLAPASC